jgi:UDP-N-acetylmuramate--alanine ligase
MWSRLRRIGIEIYCFFTAPLVVKNCLGMLGLIFGVFALTFWWMRCFTNHGESVEVPNYEKMSFREAERKAESRGFRVAVSDSLYQVGTPMGVVLKQSPVVGSRVKADRTIYFTVSKNNPDVVKLPDLSGTDDYDQYAKKLLRLDLRPRILARVPNDKLEVNTILEVLCKGDTITEKLRKGFFTDKGSVIDLIVSQKETSEVSIPDLTCHTFDEAKFLLSASNLTVGSVAAGADVTDRETAWVWRQSPRFDASSVLKVGQSIDVYLVQKRPAGCAGDEVPAEN